MVRGKHAFRAAAISTAVRLRKRSVSTAVRSDSGPIPGRPGKASVESWCFASRSPTWVTQADVLFSTSLRYSSDSLKV